MPHVLRIPDVLSSLDSFEMTVHPSAKEVTRASNEWFERFVVAVDVADSALLIDTIARSHPRFLRFASSSLTWNAVVQLQATASCCLREAHRRLRLSPPGRSVA